MNIVEYEKLKAEKAARETESCNESALLISFAFAFILTSALIRIF